MSNKLRAHIKSLIREALDTNPKSLARIGLLTKRFPLLKKTLGDLMSDSFIYYIKDIDIVAPKPTTFNVVLKNGLDFQLIYNGAKKAKNFTAKVAGKKYDLVNLGDEERATNAIADQLALSPVPKEPSSLGQAGGPADAGQAAFNDVGGGGGGLGGEIPGGEVPELPSPASEVPAGTEPAPLGGGGGPTGATPPPAPAPVQESFGKVKITSDILKELIREELRNYAKR